MAEKKTCASCWYKDEGMYTPGEGWCYLFKEKLDVVTPEHPFCAQHRGMDEKGNPLPARPIRRKSGKLGLLMAFMDVCLDPRGPGRRGR